jgi:hypothetical protein
MKKQLIILGIIALLVCVGLSGCTQVSNSINPEKNKFVGTWTYRYTTTGIASNYSITYYFFSDGTCSYQGTGGTWDIKDGKLVVDFNENGNPQSFVYSYLFSENNTKLTLNGTPYIKQ